PPAPKIALLPGSRLPEAARNLALLTQCLTHMPQPVVAWAAVTADLYAQLSHWAESHHWQWREGALHRGDRTIYCYDTAFADILNTCDAVVGMAGTAIEQAVGLGKPVIQICGSGPQFTYRFAEAQMRLLGSSVRTIGTRPATPDLLRVAAQTLNDLLHDAAYLAQCRQNGRDRVGLPGGSAAIARQFREHFLT
ncbi:MAG: hypothetical protein HC919_11620, partial [Oscillatoriales cyanobacterium SM2_2_1]|nr:hypothetical protein [Oscillatoriales cyanobacterium SM2_2_1]